MRVSAEKERGATGAHLGRDEGFAVGASRPGGWAARFCEVMRAPRLAPSFLPYPPALGKFTNDVFTLFIRLILGTGIKGKK
jgi:hypothetical protein